MHPSRRTPIVLVLLLASGCVRGGPKASARFPGAPVILVSVDTLRADRLPFYGTTGLETPALTALRADAVLFETAYAQAPLTLPSHAALLTGAGGGEHGVLDNAGYTIAPSVPTLAEVMRANGYETGGAVSSVVLEGRSGISRGFDFWEDSFEAPVPGQPMTLVQRPGADTEAILWRWVSGRREKPFLAFLHIFEPHSPYAPPEPFRSAYADPYDGEIATADAAVGAFLSRLKAAGLYDRSLIVFLSDHGEGLGDHGEKEHGIFLYRESIRVPLLLKLPDRSLAGATVASPVGLTDVFRTICETVALEGCPLRPGTVSLVALASGTDVPSRRILSETFYPRTRFGWSPLASLADERWHYIEAPRPELYDLAADPAERTNRAGEKAGPIRSMRAELEARRSPFRPPSPVDAEKARQLASLGYITATSSPGGGALPDPKDVIASLEPLREGMAALQAGRFADAVRLLSGLLDANPRVRDGWELYAQALLGLGRNEEAVEAVRRMVPLSPPGSTSVLLSVATVALQAGQVETAVRHAEAAGALGDPGAEEVVARARLAAGDLRGAEEAAHRALGRGSSRTRALLVLARVATLRGDLARALQLADEAQVAAGGELAGGRSGLHFVRGDALARLGRVAEAEADLEKEVRLFPARIEARAALVALFAAAGRQDDATEAVRGLLENVPGPEGPAAAIRSLQAIGRVAEAEAVRRAAATRYPLDVRFRER